MFVFSVKASLKQLALVGACLLILLGLTVSAVLMPGARSVSAPLSAETEEQRLYYLRSLGYQPQSPHLEVKEVLIPDEPDEVFTAYNALQQEAGFDLAEYHGKRIKCWQYRLSEDAAANLYIYQGNLVGGDILWGQETYPLKSGVI